ncbi:putative ubiquitin-conjugating enzyme E2 [Trifolium repens]|nr:putative ubiquitin-conjugating enzyme E2 [Trifolium repens]
MRPDRSWMMRRKDNNGQKDLIEWQINPQNGFKHKVIGNLQRLSKAHVLVYGIKETIAEVKLYGTSGKNEFKQSSCFKIKQSSCLRTGKNESLQDLSSFIAIRGYENVVWGRAHSRDLPDLVEYES